MARIRTARRTGPSAAVIVAALLLFAAAGTAQADSASFADHGATSSAVSDTGSGNALGPVNGPYNWTQQTATGPCATNQNNTVGVKGNSGLVQTEQINQSVNILFAPPMR